MRKNLFLKVKNSHLELEKELIELKDREVKIKREIEELTFCKKIKKKRDQLKHLV